MLTGTKISQVATIPDGSLDGDFFILVVTVDEAGDAIGNGKISLSQIANVLELPIDKLKIPDGSLDNLILVSENGQLVLKDYITDTQIANWDTAYAWGDHATVGYLTQTTGDARYRLLSQPIPISEVSGLQTTLDSKQDLSIELSAISELTAIGLLRRTGTGTWIIDTNQYLTEYVETDPLFSSSAAAGITSINISNWDTAYAWGDHALEGYLTTTTANTLYAAIAHSHVINDVTGLQTALDNKQDILVSGTNIKTINGQTLLGSGDIIISGGGSTDWSEITNKPAEFPPAAHTHIIDDVTGLQTALDGKQPLDPDLTAIAELIGTNGLLRKTAADTWSLDTTNYISSETDPVFSSSPASSITGSDLSNWDAAYGWGDHALEGYLIQSVADTLYAQLVHTHNISDITGLQLALDAKEDAGTAQGLLDSHVAALDPHPQYRLETDLVDWSELSNVPTTFQPAAHTHVISDVTGLQTALDNKQPLDADLTAIAGLTGTTGLLKKDATDTWSLDTSSYLTSESDPIFTASAASGISSTDISNWNTAFGWGDHAIEGYATETFVTDGLALKQDILVSETNIKTINGESLLGAGNLVISGGGSSPLATKGDLYTYSTVDDRLAAGTNGHVLSPNSSTATGLEWTNRLKINDFGLQAAQPTFTFDNTTIGSTDFRLRAGVIGNSVFDLFNVTGNKTIARFDTDGRMALNSDTIPDESTVIIIGHGSSGANVDARGANQFQVATFDAQAHDFGTSFSSIYMQYAGSGLTFGTILDTEIPLANLGHIVGQGTTIANMAIYSIPSIPLIFGTGNVERMRILGTGNIAIAKTTADTTVDVNGTVRATNLQVNTNDVWHAGNFDLSTKQDTLISGTNIKTINGNSLLGSGDLVISGGSNDWNDLINTPTTLAGYGITDAQPLDADLTAIAGLSGTSGLLRKTAADTWSLDTTTYALDSDVVKLSGSQTVTGNKTFTGITRLQNGSASGAMLCGADVNTTTVTDATRKLFQMSLINYTNAELPYVIFRADSNNTAASSGLQIGGTGTAAAYGFTNISFWTSPDLNQSAVSRWLIGTGGHFVPTTDNSYDIGASSFRVRDIFSRGLITETNVTAGAKAIAGHFINRSITTGTEVGLRFSPTSAPDTRFAEIVSRQEDGSNAISLSMFGARGATLTRGIYVDPDGRVGINTTSTALFSQPSNLTIEPGPNSTYSQLSVFAPTGSTRSSIRMFTGSSNSYVYTDLFDQSGVPVYNISLGNNVGRIAWVWGATERMRLTSAGSLGIGTDSPAAQLDVRGNGTMQLLRNSTDSTQMMLLQQSGTGDAVMDFLLTGVRAWRMGIDNSDGDKFKLQPTQTADFSAAVVTITTTGNLGLGGQNNPSCSIDTNGFTKLGDVAPKIKMKKLTGTAPGSAGNVSIAHGLTLAKIISSTVLLNIGGSLSPPSGTTNNAYTYIIDPTNVVVNVQGANTLGGAITVFIIYEE